MIKTCLVSAACVSIFWFAARTETHTLAILSNTFAAVIFLLLGIYCVCLKAIDDASFDDEEEETQIESQKPKPVTTTEE